MCTFSMLPRFWTGVGGFPVFVVTCQQIPRFHGLWNTVTSSELVYSDVNDVTWLSVVGNWCDWLLSRLLSDLCQITVPMSDSSQDELPERINEYLAVKGFRLRLWPPNKCLLNVPHNCYVRQVALRMYLSCLNCYLPLGVRQCLMLRNLIQHCF